MKSKRPLGDRASLPENAVLVSTTIDLAHALGLIVIAEGVETPDQLAKLEELKCELAQGFIWPNRSRARPCRRSWPDTTAGSRSGGILRRHR
jgi:EAL domain-containing protein (putative c-di-GMP-specific phosphodiesterase class I)